MDARSSPVRLREGSWQGRSRIFGTGGHNIHKRIYVLLTTQK